MTTQDKIDFFLDYLKSIQLGFIPEELQEPEAQKKENEQEGTHTSGRVTWQEENQKRQAKNSRF